MDDPKPRLGDVREVAEALGNCHPATVWRGVASGILPQPIKIGGKTLWDLREIHALVETKLAAREAAA